MAKAEKDEPTLKLPDGLIHSLVFETFGLRRFTQDSPIRPDVWLRFLKLARWRLANREMRTGPAKAYRIPLILTPKQTMSSDGRPAGHAGRLAERIRAMILQKNRSKSADFEPGDTLRREEQDALAPFRIAATSRNVAIDVTFSELMDFLLPLTAWWRKQTYANRSQLYKDLEAQTRKNATVREALVQLDDTEFFRFAGLSALVRQLVAEDVTAREFSVFMRVLAPVFMLDATVQDEDEKELFPEKFDANRMGDSGDILLEELRPFWESYSELVRDRRGAEFEVPREVDEFPEEVAIWSIQLNRPSLRQTVVATEPPRLPTAAGRPSPSSMTVKADAAKQLFGVKTSHLAWAVVDTGIDASHPAFMAAQGTSAIKSRVVATLDFTILQDLLSESETLLDEMVERATPANASTEAKDKARVAVLKVLNAIRDENVSGRQLDWSLLEKLIRVDPSEAPIPSDPHGTHVAGTLAGGMLPNGVKGDEDPFEGVCPDIKLFDLRVFSDGRSTFAAAPEDGKPQAEALTRLGGDEFTVLAALDYVAWLNRDPMRPAIHGINLSLAIPFEVDSHACGRTPICEACDRLVWNGTVVVAAAGNSGFDKDNKQARLGVGYRGMTITDPGNAREVITVGATHHSEPHTYGVSYFSSRGPTGDGRMKPDIVAPGEKIRSTAPGGKMLLMDGTSMAAPHVSGVCALLMGRYPELIGEPERIKQILMRTATDLGRERHFQGAGLVDALRALQSV
jgi:serine protease AprX